ncbi:hypothetical protein V8J88_16770 [Massilia sp. W12]|uniref:hypothetical protein n=1 Tax=Massilia sp. W12 TaxID=3126507 RepID=UPI0030D10191
MMEQRRLRFLCCNADCGKEYTLQREVSRLQVLLVACPYCKTEATVDLAPYAHAIKPVMRGQESQAQVVQLELPAVLPTQAKPQDVE